MSRKLIVLSCTIIATIILLVGCSNDSTVNISRKDELIYATPVDIKDMNPHLYTGSTSAQGMVYETLIENTEDGIKPLLAESWEISEDGRVYTFHLRRDVKFHNGEPFNAYVVKKNIEAVQDNASLHSWIKLSTKILNVKEVDEYTAEIVLSERYYPTLLELSMTRPYSFISLEDFNNGGTKDGVKGYHGTGPYMITDYKIDQYAMFEANETYWGVIPDLKKIRAKVLPAGETTYLALKKGEVNFIFTDDRGANSIDVEAMNKLVETEEYQIVRSKAMNTNMLLANSSKQESPIHETAVREAIWYSIDRETISNQLLNNTEMPANTLFSSNVNYANVELKKRGYDLDKAKMILENAKWTLEEGSKIRVKNGIKLAMKLYYDVNSPSQKVQMEFIQNSANQIGIDLQIVGEESSSIANRRSTGNYDLLFNNTWGLAYDPQSTIAAFTSKSSFYYTTKGITGAEELYKKIDEVLVTMDETKRQFLYEEILNTVHNEAVFIPITNGVVTIIAPKNLQDISFKQTQYVLPFERMYFN